MARRCRNILTTKTPRTPSIAENIGHPLVFLCVLGAFVVTPRKHASVPRMLKKGRTVIPSGARNLVFVSLDPSLTFGVTVGKP